MHWTCIIWDIYLHFGDGGYFVSKALFYLHFWMFLNKYQKTTPLRNAWQVTAVYSLPMHLRKGVFDVFSYFWHIFDFYVLFRTKTPRSLAIYLELPIVLKVSFSFYSILLFYFNYFN